MGGECIPLFSNCSTSSHTQVGILFHQDIYFGVDRNVEVSFPLGSGHTRIGKVTLTNQTAVKFLESQMASLIQLIAILDDGTNYGRSKASKQSGRLKQYDKCIQQAKASMYDCCDSDR